MSNIKKISLIIPVYNGEKTIESSLMDALNQNYANYEIVVVDDGSTDGTLGLLEKYKKSIILVSQKNAGPLSARLNGVKQSSGDYVCFMDADDNIESSYIKEMVDVLEEFNADISFCCYKYKKNTEGVIIHKAMTRDEAQLTFINSDDVNSAFYSKLFQKSMFLDVIVDGSDCQFEDVKWMYRLFHRCKVAGFSSAQLYIYNHYIGSRSRPERFSVSTLSNIFIEIVERQKFYRNNNYSIEVQIANFRSILQPCFILLKNTRYFYKTSYYNDYVQIYRKGIKKHLTTKERFKFSLVTTMPFIYYHFSRIIHGKNH